MFNKFTITLFCVLLGIEFNRAEKYKACNTHNPECPGIYTICSQRNNHDGTGDCKCTGDFEFNPTYQKDSDYCIPRPVMQPTTAAVGDATNYDKTASAVSLNQPPSSHHIVGGILIPIFLVLIVIGVTYGIKKLHIVKRVRDMMTARRSRPFYEDVMMSNDNDDPPLI